MSFHCQRHVFTVSSLRNCKRRHLADPFERDPFKIQSYNFRYAERPCFPIPVLKNVRNKSDNTEDCETYFHNNNFSTANDLNAACKKNINDKRVLKLAKFDEYRRRKLLNVPASYKNCCSTGSTCIPSTSKIWNSQSFIKKDNGNPSCSNSFSNNISQVSARNHVMPALSKCFSTTQTVEKVHQSTAPSATGSLSPGCEIKINIKALESDSRHKNVNIKIETDSMNRSFNVPLPKDSSNCLFVDKKLSKFSVKKKESDRVKDLTAIYSSQLLNQASRAKQHSASLIPFRRTHLRGSSSSILSKRLASKKSLINRMKDNLSVYDKKAVKTNHNNLNTSRFHLHSKSTLTHIPPSSLQSITSSLKEHEATSKSSLNLCRKSKLPLNININVFADKMRSFKL